MRFAVSVVLLLSLGPMRSGLSRELGSMRASGQNGEPMQGENENTGQTSQAQKGEKKPLTNDDVLSMVQAGLAESTIILAIQHSSTDFDTSPQALIALQSQGIPTEILDAMLSAGSAKPTPPAGPTVPTPANPASVGENGKWDVREEVSPTDGSRSVTMILPAEQEVSALDGMDAQPRLYIDCKSHQADVYVHTGSLPFDAEKNGKYSVRLRLDEGQPFNQDWDLSAGHDSLAAPHPVEFARMLAASKRLAIEFTPPVSEPVATWFDLSGLDGGLGKVADACGWSVQSGSPEDSRIKGSTPDLHKIRKVFLETDWADDENELARKVRSIQKRTCLQVVDTLGAADAILGWGVQGFTGAALELRSKDGEVLWGKGGGFTTPLGALKQAVGCPK